MPVAGAGAWSRDAARGAEILRLCAGCRRRHAVTTVEFDGEPVPLCERCAELRVQRPGEGSWIAETMDERAAR